MKQFKTRTMIARCCAVVAALSGLAAVSSAIVSKDYEVQLEASDDYSSVASDLIIILTDANGAELARGTPNFPNGVWKNCSITARGRFNNAVDSSAVRNINLYYPGTLQDKILFTNVALRVGPAFDRTVVLDQKQDPKWDGKRKIFPATPNTNEMDAMLKSVRLQTYVHDDARPGSPVRAIVELKNGQIHQAMGANIVELSKGGGWRHVTIDFPAPVRRSMIYKFALLNDGKDYARTPDGQQAGFAPDDVDLDDMQIDGIRENGTAQTIHRVPQRIRMEDHSNFEVADLSPALRTTFNGFNKGFFHFRINTGADDLRWKLADQPNMEFKVSAKLKNGTTVLVLGRERFPNDKFGDGGIWAGGFQSYSWAEKKIGFEGINVHDIIAFEVELVGGQRPPGNTGVLSGRAADQWSLQGFWAGASPDLSAGGSGMMFGTWATLTSNFKVSRPPMKVGEKAVFPVNTSSPFDIRNPIKIGN